MKHFFATAAAIAVLSAAIAPGAADEFLGAYVARISENDKQASDGYPLDAAAQMVRQDRANWHKFGSGDPEDEDDAWFRSTSSRARLERMLGKSDAMSQATRRAISRGEPVIEVKVFRNSVRVEVIGR